MCLGDRLLGSRLGWGEPGRPVAPAEGEVSTVAWKVCAPSPSQEPGRSARAALGIGPRRQVPA